MNVRTAILLFAAALMMGASVIGCGATLVAGGDFAGGLAGLRPVKTPGPETPWMNIPRELRTWNWGGGSCVHASTVHEMRWVPPAEFVAVGERYAQLHRDKYSGGESSYGLRSKLDRDGRKYAYTGSGDPAFLEWCSKTRRGAVIFYFPNHSINFCGYATRDGRQFAVLLDNNRINDWIWVEKAAFVRNWRGYGGFALSIIQPPTPREPVTPFQET